MTAVSGARPAIAGGLAFDIAEKVVLGAMTVSVIARLAPTLASRPCNLLVLISECLAVSLILIRRPAAHADRSAYAAAIALIGTGAPLLVAPGGAALIPPLVAFALMMAGLVCNISAKTALNRSFGLAAANRGVKRAGPYRLVRHPMYLGYLITQAGFLLTSPSPRNLAVYAVGWTAQVLRIRAEEQLLLEDADYRAYAGEVRYRLIPGLY